MDSESSLENYSEIRVELNSSLEKMLQSQKIGVMVKYVELDGNQIFGRIRFVFCTWKISLISTNTIEVIDQKNLNATIMKLSNLR